MEPHTPAVSTPDALTAPAPTIADMVGVDREAEARRLVELFIDVADDDNDPGLAFILRRRLLEGQSFDAIAAESGGDATEVAARFFSWCESVRGAMTLRQEDRRSG